MWNGKKNVIFSQNVNISENDFRHTYTQTHRHMQEKSGEILVFKVVFDGETRMMEFNEKTGVHKYRHTKEQSD